MKKRSKSTKKKERRRKPVKERTVDEYIAEAEAAMDSTDVTKALVLYETACSMLKREQDSKLEENKSQQKDLLKLSTVLGKMGEAKVSANDPDGAREDFSHAIDIIESSSIVAGNETESAQLQETKASLHLFFGQLSTNEEALSSFKAGINELESSVSLRETIRRQEKQSFTVDMLVDDKPSPCEQALFETRTQLCNAYCAVVDLYLTDLCFEENAESECEIYLARALKIADPSDNAPFVDALQTAANLRLSQSRGEEAAANIMAAYEKMKTGCEALATLVGLGIDDNTHSSNQAVELRDVEAANSLPGFEFRVQTARILLECASVINTVEVTSDFVREESIESIDPQKCVVASIQVLGSLLAENDEVIELWYLLGCAHVSLSPSNMDMARQYWERAKEMLTKVKESIEEEIAEVYGGEETTGAAKNELDNVVRQLEEVDSKLNEHADDNFMDHT